jgi:GAF domain-containing protein
MLEPLSRDVGRSIESPPRPRTERTGQTTGVAVSSESSLARALVELADTLVDDFDVVDLLTHLADRCVEVLDVSAAGIMLVAPDGSLRVAASSSEEMRLLELFELQADDGPCLECLQTGGAVFGPDLDHAEARWPRFAPEARAAGFRAAQALPLRLRGMVLGALNLFHSEPGGLSESDLVAGQALADIATIALLQHRAAQHAQQINEQLNHALNSRISIEQAKGVTAERLGIDMDDAFRHLRTYARDHNLRLADVANDVIAGSVTTDLFGAVTHQWIGYDTNTSRGFVSVCSCGWRSPAMPSAGLAAAAAESHCSES